MAAVSKQRRPAARAGSAANHGHGPVLLSGGNPQIPKGDGDEPVQAYIAAMPGWKQDVGRRLDDLIEATVPDLRKAVRYNSPFYGVEGDDGWFLAFHCLTKYVKVTFFRGTSLDPLPPVASKVDEVRYVHLHEHDLHEHELHGDGGDHDEIDDELLTSWIRQAAALPGGN